MELSYNTSVKVCAVMTRNRIEETNYKQGTIVTTSIKKSDVKILNAPYEVPTNVLVARKGSSSNNNIWYK